MFDVENPPQEALDPFDDESQDALSPQESSQRAAQKQAERLQLLQQMLSDRRREAVQARAASGVERRWLDDLDSYHGRDAVNRRADVVMTAAAGGAIGPHARSPQDSASGSRSTVFVQLTRQKTNTAASRVADMLYPQDDKNWGIKPTPDPQLMQTMKSRVGQTQVIDNGVPLTHPDTGAPLTYADLAAEKMALAQEMAKAMERQIDDQLTDCMFNAEGRKAIQDAAMLGTGILKGPSVVNQISKKWVPQTSTDANGKTTTVQVLQMLQEIRPRTYRVDPWNFYPDPACGENIQDGSYVYEREYMPGRELAKLARVPGYNGYAIMQCLQEGPQHTGAEDGSGVDLLRAQGEAYDRAGAYDDKRYELWTYTGDVSRDDLEAAGVQVPDDMESWLTTYSGVFVICNNRIIKAMLNPLDTGDFPYDVFVWERMILSPFGAGIPYLMRYAQRTLNAAWRAMLDNMALSSGPQIVMNKGAVKPADGSWNLTARKLWFMEDGEDVQKAFFVFEIPSHQQEISNIIEIAQKFADEETSLPQIAQGEKGTSPDTVGGMSILMNSANTVLRRLVKNYDDQVTRPHLKRYYDWNMQYNPDETIKGDFEIDARGSSVLIVRDQQQQAVMQLFELAQNPTFGLYVDPEKLFVKGLEMNHLTPDDVMRTPEDIAQRMKAMQQQKPPVDPKVQAAQVAAQARVQEAQINAQGEQAYIQTQQQIGRDDHAATMAEMQMKRELAILEYATKQNMQLTQVKSDLAQLALKLNSDHAMKNADRMTQAAQKTGPMDSATPSASPDSELQ
ncbi:hypothetical protein [Paraburkholderia youngii]|uniref:hypothetical protein n=1 Tax=Paraburkholderia youngii TaxID=2782701 RepID=UPI001592999C|nr:hypothetical protein [Paraburkholderia youngii]NUX58666.1 hypothetical protein [Paraburkholderia youngii]